MHNPTGYIFYGAKYANSPTVIHLELPNGDRYFVQNAYHTHGTWFIVTYVNHYNGQLSSHTVQATMKFTINFLYEAEEKANQTAKAEFISDMKIEGEDMMYVRADFGSAYFCYDCKFGECRSC